MSKNRNQGYQTFVNLLQLSIWYEKKELNLYFIIETKIKNIPLLDAKYMLNRIAYPDTNNVW